VGKTTCAAIAACTAPGRTLLVTTDPASSLADVFGTRGGAAPTRVPGAGDLRAATVDAAAAFAHWLEPRRGLLTAIALRGTYLDDEDVGRLLKLSLPGIDEIIGLLAVVQLGRGYDRVVVDTAPTGHTLRLLIAPALLGRVAALLDTLQSHHRTIVSTLRGSYVSDGADALIAELERDGQELAALLRDRTASEIAWVTLPEPMALEETADALAALRDAGIPVARLIVNRVTPPLAGDCEWCDARRRFEARALAPLLRRFAGNDVQALPDLGIEPRGVPALRKAARELQPYRPPAASVPVRRRLRARIAGAAVDLPKLAEGSRWLLFGGKGGVGKSTCAAAASLELARTRSVLLLSTDPAHSLGDVFGVSLDDRPRSVDGAPSRLRVREIDAAAEFARLRRRYVDAVDETFARIARASGSEQSTFRDLIDLAPPGIDEVIAIAEVAEALAAAGAEHDLVVTDTAPTGHALRLLQTPAILREWTQALMTILRKYREIVGAGTLAELLVQLSRRVRALQEILADRARTRFLVVTRAAALPMQESKELIASLDRLGIAVAAVVVNALGGGDCRRCGAISKAESAQLARLRRSAGAAHRYAIIGAPAELPPPHGAPALAAWSTSWRRIA